jgi:hypothetical protein
MLRASKISEYELEVRLGLKELFDTAKDRMQDSGDLLVCQQNGFLDYSGNPGIGLGEEGLDNMQTLNSISFTGIGDKTNDDDFLRN